MAQIVEEIVLPKFCLYCFEESGSRFDREHFVRAAFCERDGRESWVTKGAVSDLSKLRDATSIFVYEAAPPELRVRLEALVAAPHDHCAWERNPVTGELACHVLRRHARERAVLAEPYLKELELSRDEAEIPRLVTEIRRLRKLVGEEDKRDYGIPDR